MAVFGDGAFKEIIKVAAAAAWDSPGKNTGVGCHFLLQSSFPIETKHTSLSRASFWSFRFTFLAAY